MYRTAYKFNIWIYVLLIRLGMADLHAAINNHRDMEGRAAVRPSIIHIAGMPL